MALTVFPTLPGRSADLKWSPKHFNLPPAILDDGAAITLGVADTPLDDFELIYNFLRDDVTASAYSATELATFMGFWRSIGGSRGRFLFENPNDNSVTGEAIGTGDGTSTSFAPIVRTYGPIGYSTTEPVGYVNTSKTVRVYLNGVLQASGYTFDTSAPGQQILNFTVAPGVGVAITMDFSFYYYCRFSDESLDFNRFFTDFYMLGSVKFESCRAEPPVEITGGGGGGGSSGPAWRVFLNGALQGTAIQSATPIHSTSPMHCGIVGYLASSRYLTGWLEEIRVTDGVARYSSDFTPPTAKFPRGGGDPHWSNVALLLGFDSDANGATSTTDESPAATSVSFHGGAAVDNTHTVFSSAEGLHLPGTSAGNDYIYVPDSSAFSVANANDKTYEAWVYVTQNNVRIQGLFDKRPSSSHYEFEFSVNNTGNLRFIAYDNAGPVATIYGSDTVPINEWFHVALCRSAAG